MDVDGPDVAYSFERVSKSCLRITEPAGSHA
jgi:hypothetical protein